MQEEHEVMEMEWDEWERGSVVSRLSDDVLKENLQEQIMSRSIQSSFPTDLLRVFDERFAILEDRYQSNPDILRDLREIKDDIYSMVLSLLEERFDISTNLEDGPRQNYYYHVKKLYEFFVINYRENLIHFFTEYIRSNRKTLAQAYKKSTNKRDLGVSSLRKVLVELDDVIIIHNIRDIILGTLREEISGERILDAIVTFDEDEVVNSVIKELFLLNRNHETYLGPEFAQRFLSPLEDESQSFGLIVDIKTEVMKSMPRKS